MYQGSCPHAALQACSMHPIDTQQKLQWVQHILVVWWTVKNENKWKLHFGSVKTQKRSMKIQPRGAPELSAVQHGYGPPSQYSNVASQSWSSLTVCSHFFYVKAQMYPRWNSVICPAPCRSEPSGGLDSALPLGSDCFMDRGTNQGASALS